MDIVYQKILTLQPINAYFPTGLMTQWKTRLSSKDVPGSNPTVGKSFSFCNSRLIRLPCSSTKLMRIKSTMA